MCLGRRIIACLVLSLALCTPLLASPVSALHEEADGLVLRQGGVDIVTVWQGVVTGEIEVHHEEFTDPVSVVFLDPDGLEFIPDEPGMSLGWVVADTNIAGFELLTDWSFRLEGLVEGATDLVLSIQHEGHADFSSPAIPVHVEEHHVEADGLVLRQGGVDIVTVWQGVVTGQLSLQPGIWTPEITVMLLDPAGVEFQPDEPEFSLGWALGDTTIADVELMDVWSFRMAGETNGATGLTLSVLHEGHADFSSAPIPVVSSLTSGVALDMRTPLQVLPNLPNPFNPSTTIAFRLQERSAVTVSVHDVRGHLVTTLLDDEELDAGESSVVWDGRDASGKPVESGVYLCRVEAGSARQLRKMTLLK